MQRDEWLTKKNRRKKIRAVIEILIVLLLAVVLVRACFFPKQYEPYDASDPAVVTGKDAGFIAVSYFGVNLDGSDDITSRERLDEQLKALRDQGFVTITQKDIIDYYNSGKKLPEKALFLVFEDGRTDTAIFSEPYLEKYNFIGTMAGYAMNLNGKDPKMLDSGDLRRLDHMSFWESASNGYRLSYINVKDRYGRFLGKLTAEEYDELHPYLGRHYNHYLMDYIRDKNNLPVESYAQMKERITQDYDRMKKEYTKCIDYVPSAYLIMHANTDGYGNNIRVSEVNRENMESLFKMNFNREGYSLNTADTDIYDLTRMQAQAYWYTNHLLMRLRDDRKDEGENDITFVKGDPSRYKKWKKETGAAEFKKDSIVLTTVSKGKGTLRLKKCSALKNLRLSTELKGNLLGTQTIALRSKDGADSGITISLCAKKLTVRDSGRTLARVDLDDLEGEKPDSVEENKRDSLAEEYAVRGKKSKSLNESFAYRNEYNEKKKKDAKSVEEGAEAYKPTIQIKDPGDYKLQIRLKGDRLNVKVDGRTAVKDVRVLTMHSGGLTLESEWYDGRESEGTASGEIGGGRSSGHYSQRNIADDVYDGVFRNLHVVDTSRDKTVYDDRLQGFRLYRHKAAVFWDKLITWFIDYL
ncbi:MAG: hypothetical protein ACOYJJ_05965 [Anaerovoracaceae bacterium]|jgi:hypothetical protein